MSIEVNDKYYAYSKIDEINQKGEYGGVVTSIMKDLYVLLITQKVLLMEL